MITEYEPAEQRDLRERPKETIAAWIADIAPGMIVAETVFTARLRAVLPEFQRCLAELKRLREEADDAHQYYGRFS